MHTAVNGTAQQAWREQIAAQRGSGQSIRGWCRDHSLPEHAFYWWRARLGLSPRFRKRGHRAKSVKFAEVVLPGPPAVADPIRLNLAGGRELILPASMPVQQVAALVRALETQQ